jgi:long-chain fatty acid transport protein
VQETNLVLIALAPTFSYQATDKLSLGASAQIWYTSLDMDVAVPDPQPPGNRPDGKASIDGDDYDVGLTLGVMYEFSPQTRLGLAYQSEIESSYDSDLKISSIDLALKASLDIPLAQKLRLGLHHDLNAKWGLDFSLGWEEWSTFDHVLIQTDRIAATIDQGWDDTWHVAAGFQYHYSPEMTFTAGVSYDTSPQTDGRRTPDLPVDEQIRIAAGFTRDVRDDFTIGAYINYADLGDSRIENSAYVGEYSSNSLLQISMNFSWKFDK